MMQKVRINRDGEPITAHKGYTILFSIKMKNQITNFALFNVGIPIGECRKGMGDFIEWNMAIDNLQTLEVIEVMENFLERIRPPVHMRAKVDIGYKIEDQSVYIFELRPQWNKPEIIRETEVAKTTFIKTKNEWKVLWMGKELKWKAYSPQPTVKTIEEFIKLVSEDKYGCFWG